ncbi:hypothetical protein [Halorussus amylolyticus]|uniref:hypothetical protein n=1 Tax=Halorussus amylolyticus TaxID=1126242 RepID=UPI0010432814|nr:hypothetical protein [Halorussus amylolyticus]
MPQYQLRQLGKQNAGVSLPWRALKRDDLLKEDGTIPDDQLMDVERLGEGVYLVRPTPDDGNLPEFRETDVVQDAVARELMDMSAFDSLQPGNAD